jgi:hypothetical protein
MSPGERYLELCLRLRRHDDGLVDAYFGPPEIAERIDAEPLREPAELVAEAPRLGDETDSPYLRGQLVGLETLARKLAGEEISYADEVERCYAIRPHRVPEERFEEAHRALDEILPPDGTLAERYQRWRETDLLHADKIESVLEAINARLRERTRELFGLPEGEATEIELVTGKHWSAYNYYVGGLRSRVAVNTDVDLNASGVANLVAHELYPGHHTENAWKEQLLYVEGGRLEAAVVMYGTPQSVIAEGIAELAIEMVVDDHDAFLAEVLGEWDIGYDEDAGRRIRRAKEPLERVVANAALLLHEDGVSAEEAKAYIRRWGLVSEKRAQQNVDFVMDPIGRAYITTYTDGYDLCRDWVDGDPTRFKRLLTEQLSPADLLDSRFER